MAEQSQLGVPETPALVDQHRCEQQRQRGTAASDAKAHASHRARAERHGGDDQKDRRDKCAEAEYEALA
jgi:hypothetical protein